MGWNTAASKNNNNNYMTFSPTWILLLRRCILLLLVKINDQQRDDGSDKLMLVRLSAWRAFRAIKIRRLLCCKESIIMCLSPRTYRATVKYVRNRYARNVKYLIDLWLIFLTQHEEEHTHRTQDSGWDWEILLWFWFLASLVIVKRNIVLGVRNKCSASFQPCIISSFFLPFSGIEELAAFVIPTKVWGLNYTGVPRPLLLNLLVCNGFFNPHSISWRWWGSGWDLKWQEIEWGW